MGARWVKTVVCAITLACALPSGVLLAHVLRGTSACHRLASHAIPCRDSQNLEPRHSHRLTLRPLTATREHRVTGWTVVALRASIHISARPRLHPGPIWRLEPPTVTLDEKWVKPLLRAP